MCVQEHILPTRTVIPLSTPGSNSKIGPTVSDAERAKVDVIGARTVVRQKGVRRAGVAVTNHELVDDQDLSSLWISPRPG